MRHYYIGVLKNGIEFNKKMEDEFKEKGIDILKFYPKLNIVRLVSTDKITAFELKEYIDYLEDEKVFEANNI